MNFGSGAALSGWTRHEEIGTMEALPALATGSIRQRPVAPHLRDRFSCVWVHKLPELEMPPIVITPDGTIDLQWIDGSFRIAGPDKTPQTEAIPGGAMVIGFRFQPAAAAAFFGVPAAELASQRIALDDVWGSRARRLADNVRPQQGLANLIETIETSIAENAPERSSSDASMRAAYDLIASQPPPGAPLVPWLQRALGMSERTLRRRFDESFGYGPKTLDRILRYQRFLRLSNTSKSPTAVLAVEAGYSDQAHLVRESKRLTGRTPVELERIGRSLPTAP